MAKGKTKASERSGSKGSQRPESQKRQHQASREASRHLTREVSRQDSHQASRKAPHNASHQASHQASRTDVICGRRAVEEALAAGVPLKSAFVADRSVERAGAPDAALDQLAARLEEAGVPVERVARTSLDALSNHGAHQGVVVRTKPFEYASLLDVIARAGAGDALVVVLDHVTDQGNFGAIVRSAEVVGAAGVVVAKARAATVGVGAYKTSAGAVLHLPIAQVSNLARAIDDLKEAGFWACAATEHASDDVWHVPMGGRLALVMGAEDKGISRLVAERCDFSCRLPQRGRVESLNVAQAATVLCYEWLRCTTVSSSEVSTASPGDADV